jgi:hypothetical protein
MLTGTRPFPGPRVTFLPSRSLKWGFRVFFRSSFPTLVALPSLPPEQSHPAADFQLASGPKFQLAKTSKTQNHQKLPKSLWDQEKSCWEWPVGLVDFLPEV